MAFALVGDVGGTNARMALCNLESGEISSVKTYPTSYPSLEEVIRQYLKDTGAEVKNSCNAMAGPIKGDEVVMTNASWSFSIKETKEHLGFDQLEIINDFTAVSMAVTQMKPEDLRKVGGGEPESHKPIAVYGPGTGLGVAHLIYTGRKYISVPGEGGHVDFAANSEEEDQILEILRKQFGHVSYERILSGPGLVNLYEAIVFADKRTPERLTPAEVAIRAKQNSDTDCFRALNLFCIILGRFGGDLALTAGAFGGVYIAGGIIPKNLDFFLKSGFRTAFEDKGRFKEYLSKIPVYVIVNDQPGLVGSAAVIRQKLGAKA